MKGKKIEKRLIPFFSFFFFFSFHFFFIGVNAFVPDRRNDCGAQ